MSNNITNKLNAMEYIDYGTFKIRMVNDDEYEIIFYDGRKLVVDEGIAVDLIRSKFFAEGISKEALGLMPTDPYSQKSWAKHYWNNFPNVDFDITLPYCSNFFNAGYSSGKDGNEAIMYFKSGQTVSRNELKTMSIRLAGYLQQIKTRPRIAIFVNNTVEEPVTLLATSLCGGVLHPVDITKTPEDMKKSIENFEPDIIIADEKMMPILDYVNAKEVPTIVANAKNELMRDDIIPFNKAIELGQAESLKPVENYHPNDPFLVITSSGTTGAPKPIVLSNRAVNLAILKVLFTDYPLNKDNVMLKVIPAHIGLGIITTLSTCLISGTKLAFVEGNGPADSVNLTLEFVRNFNKFRKEHNLSDNQQLLMFAAPMFYRAMLNEIDTFTDLSFISCMLAAGSKMSKEELDLMKLKFGEKGCCTDVGNGYGSNENAGAVTLCTAAHNLFGSAGFPVIGTDVLVLDDNGKPVIDSQGKIFVGSGSQFLEYLNMPSATDKTRTYFDKYGMLINMGDIGHMGPNGDLYVTGRDTRTITKYDCKISIDHIEEKLRQHLGIKECAIVALQNNSMDIVYAFVIPNMDFGYDDIVKDITNQPNWLTPLEMPDYVIEMSELPCLTSGKHDYQALTEIAKKMQVTNDNPPKRRALTREDKNPQE